MPFLQSVTTMPLSGWSRHSSLGPPADGCGGCSLISPVRSTAAVGVNICELAYNDLQCISRNRTAGSQANFNFLRICQTIFCSSSAISIPAARPKCASLPPSYQHWLFSIDHAEWVVVSSPFPSDEYSPGSFLVSVSFLENHVLK